MSNAAPPLHDLFWECTLRCNAFCAFCGSSCGEVFTRELTTEQILAAFRDIAENMDASQIMINVTGGEPLLRRDLFEVMTECTAMGFSWGMVTNGILITPEIIEKMRLAGMKTISVSLDGLEQTHEALRGVKGSFSTIVNNLRLLVQAGFLEHLQVTTVVSKKNIGQLDDLYALLKPMGLGSWRVGIVDSIGRADGADALLLGREELEIYLDFIEAHHADPVLPVVTSCSHYLAEREDGIRSRAFTCRTGKTVGSILANGDIYVCPNVPRRPELVQGNILRDSFAEVWKHGFRYFRNSDVRKAKECATCPDWTKCWGDSAHSWDYDRLQPKFCYRRFFPSEAPRLPSLDEVLVTLKQQIGPFSGIHIRYGWKNHVPVVFTPNAARELYHFFHWGQRHPQNLSELLAALIGHKLSDGYLIEFVSPAYLERRNTTEAVFSKTSLQSGYTEADAINVSYSSSDLRLLSTPCTLLGFVHSHPDELELFLSVADATSHKDLVDRGMEVSMILNPQKRQMAAYVGEHMALAELRLLGGSEELQHWEIHE